MEKEELHSELKDEYLRKKRESLKTKNMLFKEIYEE